jgi:hypothetical protein
MYGKWLLNIRSGNDARDRQFPLEVVRRAGEGILIHIEALQDTAAGLQAFAAALQRAAAAEDMAGADKPAGGEGTQREHGPVARAGERCGGAPAGPWAAAR